MGRLPVQSLLYVELAGADRCREDRHGGLDLVGHAQHLAQHQVTRRDAREHDLGHAAALLLDHGGQGLGVRQFPADEFSRGTVNVTRTPARRSGGRIHIQR